MIIPRGYILEKFFTHCKRPTLKKSSSVYNAECPYCKEGKSAGRKRRFFYIPEKEYMFCHNCGVTKKPLQFIMDQSGMSYPEVISEMSEYSTPVEDILKQKNTDVRKENKEALPTDSINLSDPCQVQFYKSHKIVREALDYIHQRHLDIAVNRPHALWLSLTDEIHRDRLCFPFYDYGSRYDISFYQTRVLPSQDTGNGPKYLSKVGANKTLYNIQNINPDTEVVWLLEGPIDSMFIRNAVAIASTYLTDIQQELLLRHFPLHKHVYVLDNQWLDKTSLKRTAELVQDGYSVFIWPKSLRKYKDANELCVKTNISEIPIKYMQQHIYSGLKAELLLQEITRSVLVQV